MAQINGIGLTQTATRFNMKKTFLLITIPLFFCSRLVMAETQDMCPLLNSEIARIDNELHSSELGGRKAIAYGQTYPGGF